MLRLRLGIRERIVFFVKWLLMLRWEREWASRFDRVLAVSAREAEWLRAADPRLSISVIENGIDTRQHQALPEPSEPHTLLFAGTMGYPPNVDAVLWFCREMLPRIQQQIPDVKFLVVGHHPSPEIRKLDERPNITVTGHVSEMRPYYERASVCIVPLRAGGGTRLKILEAMALGRPVLSTTLGCEGLHVQYGKELLIADTPEAFAKHAVGILQNCTLRERLAQEGRLCVEQGYDWSIIGQKLLNVYTQLL
ncbi:MAG: glycosyltransferase [bacterium]|nr:glycosyltransferase [bacterium]